MARAQIWKVTATPRARFRLSQVLMSPALRFRRKTLGQLARARAALGLVGVTEVGIEHKRVHDRYGADNRTRHRFEITAETAEFLLERLNEVDLTGFDAVVLEDLIGQLEEGKDAADWEAAAAFDAVEELPRWKPKPQAPVIEDPEHFIEVFGELLQIADGDLRKLTDLYGEAMRPVTEAEAEAA